MDTTLKENSYNVFEEVPRLLRNFPQEDLRHFMSLGRTIHYKPYDTIVVESDEPANAAFLIVSGRVFVTKDGVKLAEIGEGDFLGETFLFNQGSRIASAIADTDALALRFERDDVIDFFRKKPEKLFKLFILNILEIQQRRIGDLNNKLIDCRHKKETGETDEY